MLNTTLKSLQMVDLHGQYQHIANEVNQAIQEVISDTAFINGPAVKQFANALAEYMDVEHVIPCGNGTDALQIAMMALGLKPGDEVIVPTFTYVATVEVIALLGLTPVFIDVNPQTYNLDVKQLEEKITNKTRAIVPVHLYGQCADMEAILAVAEKHNLYTIEDTAQAIGAEYKSSDGKIMKAGTIGTIGTTSFFPSKNLGCFGDGGAIFTRNAELAASMKAIANHGQEKKYYHDRIGVNSRLDSVQAAILNVKLKHLDTYCENRRKAATFYDNALSSVEQVETPQRSENSTHVFHQYTLKVKNGQRDALKAFLQEKGIPSVVYYPVPLHLQNAYKNYGYSRGDFPVAEALIEEVLSLPMHTELDEEQLQFITDQVKQFFNE